MILLIDNYDSFVYNLARYIGRVGKPREVVRNDAITLADISLHPPEAIILSPGPKAPKDAGICNDIIKHFGSRIPILGVCLGHQCIGEVYGGQTIRAPAPVHGKTSLMEHDMDGIFMGIPNPLRGARYHSLVSHIPAGAPLKITAQTEDDRIIMGVQHTQYPVYGIQFHPESVMTEYGLDIIRNFTLLADNWNSRHARRAA